jgi:hypothetical protein
VAGDGHHTPLTGDSTVAEWVAHPFGSALIEAAGYLERIGMDAANLPPMVAITPVGRLGSFVPGVTREELEQLVLAARDARAESGQAERRPPEPR